jgi:hypothetical protein
MPRGFAHDQVLLQAVAGALAAHAIWIRHEVRVRGPDFTGFCDLVANIDGKLLVVEAELSAKRVARDVRKALLLGAHCLWIVVPNGKVRRAAQRQLSKLPLEDANTIPTSILLLSHIPQQLTNCIRLFSEPSAESANRKTNQPQAILITQTQQRGGVS